MSFNCNWVIHYWWCSSIKDSQSHHQSKILNTTVASRNGSQGMPGHPPKNRILTGLSNTFGKVLMFNADNNKLRFLATAIFISVTVTIMLNADINLSLDFTVLWLLSLLISCWIYSVASHQWRGHPPKKLFHNATDHQLKIINPTIN